MCNFDLENESITTFNPRMSGSAISTVLLVGKEEIDRSSLTTVSNQTEVCLAFALPTIVASEEDQASIANFSI